MRAGKGRAHHLIGAARELLVYRVGKDCGRGISQKTANWNRTYYANTLFGCNKPI